VLELPLDRPRPSVQTHEAAYQSLALTEELVGALKELSRKSGVTLFMTLLAAFKVLLARYSGQEDVVVGTPIANRTHGELEPLIGFFVNMLALRTDLSGDPTFKGLLARVREVCLGAYAHQELPFEKLVEELAPVRSLSHSPLFQVAFSLENVPLTSLRLPSLEVSRFGELQESAKFDVSVTINEIGEHVSGFITYNTALFEPETIERMAGHFRTLLSAVVSDPSQRLSGLPMLGDAERRLLSDWGGDGRPYRAGVCAHQLFEEQAARTPYRTALSFRGRHLSYSELDERAERLARRLRRRGVGPETTVGVLLERTPELVVALLAVWKAGGAYLPLDPTHPRHRLSFVISNAEPRLVITEGQLAELLPEDSAPPLVLDAEGGAETGDGPAAEEGGGDDSPAEVRAEHMAYVIYTSGSTGEPKGVMVEHRQLVSTLCAAAEHFGLDADDAAVCSAPAAFDIFLFELLSPLLCGGRVLLTDNRELLEEAVMEEVLREATFFHSTPGLMSQAVGFAARQEAGRYGQMKTLLVGGDAVPPDLLRQMRAAFPSAEVHIGYGPTEATMICTAWRVPEGAEVEQQLMGKALGNARLRLCDRHGRLVPVGVVGEVYIGGAGVAKGYLKREELTRERFVELGGERYYRSGDLARFLPDGVLAFAGRADTQVKVRGYRIELGEVEAALARHPGVSQCAVVARDEGGEKRLVAYVVGGEGAAPSAAELRAHLAGQVPQYMVPSQFVGLDALPLNANGKVEKRALPEPPAQAGDEGEYVAPRSPAEELVAALWAEVLKVSRVGVRDDFFALGGHSILAARVVNRMKECFGVEIPLRDLFECPTVADIVERVEGYLKAGYGVEAPPLARAPRDRPLPLSFAQQRLWFMHQLEPDSPIYNSPFSLSLEGALDVRAMEATLNEIVRRHEILRTQYEVRDDEPVQVITPARPFAIPLVDLSALPEGARREEALRLAASEAQCPFDLSRAPMMRATLLRLSETEHMLLFTMPHIVTDVGSTDVLIGEVAALYPAYLEGAPSPLPEFTIQYADYACWQRRWLRGEVMEKYLAYWRRQLGGALPVLSLPTDKPRPPVQTFNGNSLSDALSPGLGGALAGFSRREGCTLFMTLLAAFAVLLSRRAGQEDVLVGTANANRPHAELERLMGFFVNMLVVRADLSGDPTFKKLLARVKEATLGAYAHQEMPFERLVEELVVKRSAGHPPLVQVAFGVRHPRQQMLQLPGLELKRFSMGSNTGRFDLTLWVVIDGDDLRADWIYNVDLFEAETITRLSRQFDTLLQSILSQPDARLSQLVMTTAEEGCEQEALLRGRQEANAKRLKSVRRKHVSLSPAAPPGGD
jgi:amino acid adenylation domain-containing protein